MHRPFTTDGSWVRGGRLLASLVAAITIVATGSASASLAQGDASPTVQPSAVPFGDPGPLAPGSYYAPIGTAQWTVTVPAGWEWFYDIVWSDLGVPGTYMDVGGPGEVGFGWWEVANVFADPCHWKDTLADPPVGPTVDDLAAALVAQVGRNGSGPTDVVLGGYPAKRIELSVPADLDVATCDQGVYREWLGMGEAVSANPEDFSQTNTPGKLSVLYILDIDGTRFVMNTWHHAESSQQDLAELEAMLGSILIGSPAPVPAASPVALAGSPRPPIGEPADDGARIVQIDTVDARTRDLTIESPSVGTVQVRLLLPAGFDAAGPADSPVLYLLHGYGGSHTDWTDLTDVEALVAPTDLLVVMPDADEGWYTDAWNGGGGGQPAWETFHMPELVQLLERNWGAGDRRVVAGLSMGGLGAMDYAARHPGMFQAAASYSGVLDTIDLGLFRGEEVFGDPVTEADNWTAHNPLDLTSKLKGTQLYVAYGDGRPGPLDFVGEPDTDTELWIAPQNDRFVKRLAELGIPATVDAYGPGTHDWPYWQRALHESLPMLLEALGEPGLTASPAVSSAAP